MPQDAQLEIDPDLAEKVFFPHHARKRAELKGKKRFVHYTNAQAAMSIIRSGQVWMRNAGWMNDFTEVQHGLDCLSKAYKSDVGKKLKAEIEGLHPGFMTNLEKHFDGWQLAMKFETYLTCVSEHENIEDDLGRLSMWRAYGQSTGVALVMNSDVFFTRSNALNAFSSPVAYLDDKGFAKHFEELVKNIFDNFDWVRSLPLEVFYSALFNAFLFGVYCTKHPGYLEEKEYRVIHCPRIYPSQRLIMNVETIHGTPQIVYKIPLQNVPDEGLVGLNPAELIDRIIIGPSAYPFAAYQAFVELLREAGIPEPEGRVFTSQIPLRC